LRQFFIHPVDEPTNRLQIEKQMLNACMLQ